LNNGYAKNSRHKNKIKTGPQTDYPIKNSVRHKNLTEKFIKKPQKYLGLIKIIPDNV
jgi:hypothetical protein